MKKQLLATMALSLLLIGCSSSSSNTATATESTPVPSESSESTVIDVVSSEFKATMDAYEEFFNEYVEFMKNYDPTTLDSETIDHYTELMQKYNEYISALENVETDTLSKADRAYYIEVSGRIQKKLLEVAK